MSARDWYATIFSAVSSAITRWLKTVRAAVFAAGHNHPDPSAVMSTMPVWMGEVDTILEALTKVQEAAWADQSGNPAISVNAFMLSQLALTKNLLVRLPDEVYNRIFAEITQGQQAGESAEQIADRVDAALIFTGSEWWANRAKVITRTETNRAWQSGTLAAAQYYEPPMGRGWVKEWNTDMDGNERPSHRRANGQVRRLTDTFTVGGANLTYPLDPAGPADQVINCVVGDTRIQAVGLGSAYRYWNDKPLVRIATADGLTLSVSRNHPVLTVQGWVPACEIEQGDNLIRTAGVGGLAGTEPDVEAKPVKAEQIFDALEKSGRRHRVSGLDVNFHGDLIDGNVDIVFADRLLSFGVDATLGEHVYQLLLACSDASAASGSPLFECAVRALDTPSRIVSFADLKNALLGAHPGPLESFGLAGISGCDADQAKPATDCDSVDAEVFAQLVDRASRLVSIDKVIDVDLNYLHHGYLYTFETVSGVYMANAVASHNCRCDMIIREA